jgi:drug/metabolite transporter (DMT)-like permease
MGNERHAVLSALIAVAMWSTVATGFKLGLANMTPLQLLTLGSTLSTVVFILAALRKGWPRAGWRMREGVLFGLINPICYYLILFEAYDRLPAQLAQPLNYTWAITLALLAVPVLKQRLKGRTIVGIGISYLGVVVLVSQGRFDQLPDIDLLGVALALASTVLWAGYWLFNARSRTEPEAFMATSFCLATPVLIVLCALGPGFPEITAANLGYGAWVGVVEMGVTFLLWQRALRLTRNAARIGQLIFLSPFLSLLLIAEVLEEQVVLSSWLGLGIIVIGLLITGRPRMSDQQDPVDREAI